MARVDELTLSFVRDGHAWTHGLDVEAKEGVDLLGRPPDPAQDGRASGPPTDPGASGPRQTRGAGNDRLLDDRPAGQLPARPPAAPARGRRRRRERLDPVRDAHARARTRAAGLDDGLRRDDRVRRRDARARAHDDRRRRREAARPARAADEQDVRPADRGQRRGRRRRQARCGSSSTPASATVASRWTSSAFRPRPARRPRQGQVLRRRAGGEVRHPAGHDQRRAADRRRADAAALRRLAGGARRQLRAGRDRLLRRDRAAFPARVPPGAGADRRPAVPLRQQRLRRLRDQPRAEAPADRAARDVPADRRLRRLGAGAARSGRQRAHARRRAPQPARRRRTGWRPASASPPSGS